MVRGSGKFKTKRGGGRNFSKHMVLDADGTAVPDQKWRNKGEENSDSESGSEEASEESAEASEEEQEAQPEMSRAERKAMKKKQDVEKTAGEDEEEEDPDLINPNHVQKKMNIKDLNAPRELSRREREQKEKKDAQDRYWKLHEQGKTDQAKSDLARLAKIRAEREQAKAKREA
ncbi:casein kinase substrate phosphoprotein PP28-domain-containing protein [Flagelloscypha sp. PMI_526]|nr:casein kinase substrate phosphoprotein PP28-domain-containing protein [Flagelloscypha sp. PMI_526]